MTVNRTEALNPALVTTRRLSAAELAAAWATAYRAKR
jgi:hypothetical protein